MEKVVHCISAQRCADAYSTHADFSQLVDCDRWIAKSHNHIDGFGDRVYDQLPIALAQRALDMAAAHVSQRSTFGSPLGERQAVQFMLAECASQLYMARLMLLHLAYKAERGLDLSQENGIAKVSLAGMVQTVVDTAIQLYGALGYSRDTACGGDLL